MTKTRDFVTSYDRPFVVMQSADGKRLIVREGHATPFYGDSIVGRIIAKSGREAGEKFQANCRARVAAAASEWVPVGSNAGTFGAAECCRAVGTGDPKAGTYYVEANVLTGEERSTGCDRDKAPGRCVYDRGEWSARNAAVRILQSIAAKRITLDL